VRGDSGLTRSSVHRDLSAASMQADLQTWLGTALTVVLRSALLFGTAAGIAMAYSAYRHGSLWQIPLLIGACGVLAAAALWQRLRFLVRVWALLLVLYCAGVGLLVLTETPGAGLCLLLLVPYLAALFAGSRVASALVGLATGTLLVLAALEVSGRLAPFQAAPASAAEWIVMGLVYVAVALALVIPARHLERHLVDGLRKARQRVADLASEQAWLQREVAERTTELELSAQYLAAITELTQSAASILDNPQGLLDHVVEMISERLAFYHTAVFLTDRDRAWLDLQAASSKEGRELLAEGFRLSMDGDGIVGRAAIEGVAQVMRGLREDARTAENTCPADTQSELALPLRVRGETIGVLDVHSTELGAFDDKDIGVLQILADQLAVALSNARLSRQVQDTAAAMRRVYGEMGLERWQSLLRARGKLIVQHDPGGALADHAPERGGRRSLDDGSWGVSEGMEAAVTVPVQVRGGHVIGAVRALKPDDAGPWNSDELELLHALVDQLGVALDGAQLYQESQERAERERLIAGVSARMRETLDIDAVMRTAVREIGELMGFAEVELRMGNGQGANCE
jgi:GAF domain-containing protein